jgi:hypothetical protein
VEELLVMDLLEEQTIMIQALVEYVMEAVVAVALVVLAALQHKVLILFIL